MTDAADAGRLRRGWEAIVNGRADGAGASLARGALRLVSPLYATGLKANLALYTRGFKARTRPALPVVSVGNLTLGGTGKTTVAAFLARRLQSEVKPAVVLRGYGRADEAAPVLVSDGARVHADLDRAGDEALMLARLLPGCAVAVGKRREEVIALARERADAQVIVLDDGFQYFRMARDLDIVLLDALAEPISWRLFPAGRLREPVAHLRRADQVWITHADLAPPERVEALRDLADRHCPGRPVVVTRHRPGGLRPLREGGSAPDTLADLRVIALSALGNPHAFEAALAQAGAEVVPLRFADHHAYTPADYDRVRSLAQDRGARWVVTTEKDAVKLPPPPEPCPPVAVLGCELEIVAGGEHLDEALRNLCPQQARESC